MIPRRWRRSEADQVVRSPEDPGAVWTLSAALRAAPCPDLGPSDRDTQDRWRDKCWLNVPGPIYTGMTDTCWCGRLEAPASVLYGGDEENYGEFIFRQPRDEGELEAVASASRAEVFDGYAGDGDAHWTPDLVRAWWADIARVLDWCDRHEDNDEYLKGADQRLREGIRDFRTYITSGELELDLRRYLFQLARGVSPGPDDSLPELAP